MSKWLSAFLLTLVVLPVPGAAGDSPVWPTLGEQLRAARVVPHSALEALIAANQDFSILRPEEAKDRIGIPLWLRVHWRRAHPEGVYSGQDPTGGYPLVLKEAYEWMLSHQDLVPGPGEKDADPERSVAVTGEQRISGLQSAPRSESDIRVNYWDPMKIVGASNNISGGGNQAQFFSTDGGASWGQTILPRISGDAFHSDPTVEWTSDGTAWSTTIGIDASVSRLQMRAYKSIDNGATWTFDATFSGTQTFADKQMMWVDHSAASPFKDTIYAIWHNGAPAFVNRRTGPAGSWQTPLRVSGAETIGTAIGGDIKTNAFGDVFAFWPTTGNQRIFVAESANGGVSFGAPVQIATTFESFEVAVPSFNNRLALIYVSGGAYRTASKNMVYAAWTDLSGEPGCNAVGSDPGSNVTSSCKSRIWFSRSSDGGATWSPPVKLNNQPSLNDQFNPWLVVDETTGALGIMYYDTVGDSARRKVDVWYQSSFNDGATWLPAAKVTTAQTDESVAGADSGNQFGDYNSLSGIAGTFFPSWTDRRSNAREEIWTAKVSDPACTIPGAPAIGSAAATGANQIQVTWGNGSPPANAFDVYRAFGTCASPGAFTRIAGGVGGSPYTDGTVSGGSTYAYRIRGVDTTGNCESAPSACVEATATGACTLPPAFAGLASATNQATATCGVALAWTAATPRCSGPLTYSVYRSTSAGFTPGPGNQIAAGVTGTSFEDTSTLSSATTYHYVVRAVDAANGADDGNAVQRSAAPTGPTTVSSLTETFETAGGFDNLGWTHAALTGTVDWTWLTTDLSQSPTHSWFSDSQSSVSDRVLVSPSFTPLAESTLSFWHTFAFENSGICFDGGTLEISTDGGGSWSVVPDAAFTQGGFNGTVEPASGNPIGGKRGWCHGSLGTMTRVAVNLGSFAGATDAKLRWHEGDDISLEISGWMVDSVTLANVGLPSSCSPHVIVSAPLDFFTVTPCRLVDTRNPDGPNGGPALQPSALRLFVLAGSCGVPADAKALSVNVTVAQPAAGGSLSLFPGDQFPPVTSTIDFSPSDVTRANNAIIGLALDGSGGIKVRNGSPGTVHFILDVTGYFQ